MSDWFCDCGPRRAYIMAHSPSEAAYTPLVSLKSSGWLYSLSVGFSSFRFPA